KGPHAMSWFRYVCPAAAAAVAVALMGVPARAADADKYLPADARAIVFVNVRQTLDAPLVKKKGQDLIKAALEQNADGQKMLSAAGVDPIKDVSSITLVTTGAPTDPEKALVIVHGSFDLEKAQAAAEDYAKKNPGRLKITKEDGLILYESSAPTESGPAG